MTTQLRERIELTQAIAKTQTGDRLELARQTGRPRFAEVVDDPRIADGIIIDAALIIGTVRDEGGSFAVASGKATKRFSKATAKLVMLDHFGEYS